MKVIRDNILGFLKFVWLLCSMFVPIRMSLRPVAVCEETDNKETKYRNIVGHKSEPLIAPSETKFCPKCHVAVAQLRRTKDGIQIVRNGVALVTFGSNLIIQNGKEVRGFPINCPNGHVVRIE